MGCEGTLPFWVYYIPFLGWLAPTANPEASIFRRFSNEYSLPGGPLVFKAFQFFELNSACLSIGSIGVHRLTGSNMRSFVVSVATFISLYALLLLLASSHVSSSDTSITRSWYIAKATTRSGNVTIYANFHHYIIDYNADYWPPSFAMHYPEVARGLPVSGTQIRTWMDANCTHWFESNPLNPDSNDPTTYPIFCDNAYEMGVRSYTAIVFAILFAIPAIALALQRGTMFGDLNCVKSHGILLSCINLLLVGIVLRAVYNFKVGLPFALQNTVSDALNGDPLYWDTGPVQWLFMLLFLLRAVELILHSVLATPTFRHKRAACPNTLTQYMLGPKALDTRILEVRNQYADPLPYPSDLQFAQP